MRRGFSFFNVMTFNVSQLSVSRHQRVVLSHLSLTIAPGDLVGVLGPNGAGKSSLLAALAGELAATPGAIEIDAHTLEQLSPLQQAQRRAVVTQQSNLSFNLRVCEVVQMGAYAARQASQEEVNQWLQRALTLTELLQLSEHVYTALSGGEQQRVQLARALVQCFAIEQAHGVAYLLLDEPLANLDPRHQFQFMEMLEQLVRSARVGVLMVVHDLNIAARYCTRLVLLGKGKVIAQGLPSEVLTPATLKQAFELEWTVMPHPKDSNRLLVLT